MNYDGIIEKPSLNDLFIEHHGIKGMRWGVRHDYVPIGNNGSVVRKKKPSNLITKMAANNAKHWNKGKKKPKNGKMYNRFYQKYKDQGLSDEEADKAARKKEKITKIAIGVAGVSIAALGGYAVYKHSKSKNIVGNISSKKSGDIPNFWDPSRNERPKGRSLENPIITNRRTETSRTVTPKSGGASSVTNRRTDASRTVTPKSRVSKVNIQKTDIPRTNVKKTDIPRTNVKKTNVQRTDPFSDLDDYTQELLKKNAKKLSKW